MTKSTNQIMSEVYGKLEKSISLINKKVGKTRDQILAEEIVKEKDVESRKNILENTKTLRKQINIRYHRTNINKINRLRIDPSIKDDFRKGLIKIGEYDKEVKIIIDCMRKIVDEEDETKRQKIANKTLKKLGVMSI